MVEVYLETGRTWTFAAALAWPGWCRRGKGELAALEALAAYEGRYASVAGTSFTGGTFSVVGRLTGTPTTDFGVPHAHGPWDDEPLEVEEAVRQAGLVAACWRTFDEVVASSPQDLRKGPRGGGRDRDAIVGHVVEAERAYGRKIGARIAPRTPSLEHRETLLSVLREAPTEVSWPVPYAARRIAWHVLDHAWEIEDRRV